jgi:hypothetical protein
MNSHLKKQNIYFYFTIFNKNMYKKRVVFFVVPKKVGTMNYLETLIKLEASMILFFSCKDNDVISSVSTHVSSLFNELE